MAGRLLSRRQRSSYTKPFKTLVAQECLQPVASMCSVAISHGINANVIRKWLAFSRRGAVLQIRHVLL
ncbi:transposase [Pseudomonas phoenicis]|uniref:transposase n=1 Tax=unclassified Pseudomonas TaxID=196821 RepID=UPI0039A20D0E